MHLSSFRIIIHDNLILIIDENPLSSQGDLNIGAYNENHSAMRYPIGIQTFRRIREDGYVYVDKTDLIYKLAQDGVYYFLSRPRRFGKSLTISTLEAYFLGQKELFTGLKIENLEKEWTVHPVLHLDLNMGKYDSMDALRNQLNLALNKWEELYGTGKDEHAPNERFSGIIERAYKQTGCKVVILVDEYDKPLLQCIDKPDLQDEMRSELKAFYSVLKSQDRYIRFSFLTGVTKFSKVSVFSDLNNLNDISLEPAYERLCGISKEELTDFFAEPIREIGEENDYTYDETLAELKKCYDGYHFSRKLTDIFNPFSLLNAFKKNDFGSYWFESGTPTFLVKLLRDNDIDLSSLERLEMDEKALGNVDVMYTNPSPVLYQSGYLTIKGYDKSSRLYTLSFPNEEVKEGFLTFLIPFYTPIDATASASIINQLVKAVRQGQMQNFLIILKSFFSGYNYELIPRHDLERHYQNVIFTVCRLIGLRVEAEMHTSNGRIDMCLQTKDAIYIFEFKLNVEITEARIQIERKDYAAMFAADSRPKVKIGVNFDSEIRSIKDWTIE